MVDYPLAGGPLPPFAVTVRRVSILFLYDLSGGRDLVETSATTYVQKGP
jgi:hypothetical protein